MIKKSGKPVELLLGIGIGMHGLVNKDDGMIMFAPDWKWENVDLVTPIYQEFHKCVVIENVVRAYAVGEQLFGAGNGVNDFICIYLGYGIGSAIVINASSGNSGTSGEFGHLVLQKDGPLCDCGNQGCLEALSSSYAISGKARELIEQGEKSLIIDMVDVKTG